jgi:transcriptional regulator with PAS, ATPase and Fis domain
LDKKPAVDEVRDDQDRPTLLPAGEFVPILESNDPVMQRLLEKARRAAASDAMILLTGESGTGKDALAYQIHRWSARAEAPFVPVNCRGYSEQLLESELFGQTRGAFSGATEEKTGRLEAAHGGSVLVDEISDLTPPLQTKLLHFIKEQSFERVGGENTIAVDVRIIAASSNDLVSEVATQRFREDLYYRLGVITLQVPALRDRPGDILPLATCMLAAAAVRMHRPRLSLSPEASSALMRYRWPGNIFQLGNAIERAVVLCQGDLVTPEYLPDALANERSQPRSAAAPSARLDDIERDQIIRVMAESPTLGSAAHKLGINVVTLWRRRKRYGLDSILHFPKN